MVGPLCRQMPLSAEAGANAVNAREEPDLQQQQAAEPLAPSMKKPKGVEKAQNKTTAAKKRSLKRL